MASKMEEMENVWHDTPLYTRTVALTLSVRLIVATGSYTRAHAVSTTERSSTFSPMERRAISIATRQTSDTRPSLF